MKRVLGTLLTAAALVALTVAGCAEEDAPASTFPPPAPAATTAPVSEPAAPGPTAAPAPPSQDTGGGAKVQPAPLAQTRIIVHTARMTLVVDDVAGTVDGVVNLAGDLGGWVVGSEETSRHGGTVAIRVPAGFLEEAFRRLEALAIEVESRVVTSEDFTDQYVDTQSRLTSMRATEVRLLSFLELANGVDDALQVQEELSKLQLSMEEMQGRLNLLDQTSAYSLIEVTLKLSSVAMDVDAGPDPSFRVGQVARFRASFMPPPGIEDASFVWDFGDGSTISGEGSAPTPDGRRVTATVNHTYDDDRDSPYIVTIDLTATGKEGIAEGSDSLLVSVSEVPSIEVFAGDDRTVEEGDKGSYSASFTRPEELWDYQYQWDFGDGSPTVTGSPQEGVTRIETTHSFNDYRPTAYRAAFTVSAMSDGGRVSASDSFSVTVTEAEGLVVGGWDVSGTAKAAFRALSAVARVALVAIIWVGIFSPLILIVVGVGYLLNRYKGRVKLPDWLSPPQPPAARRPFGPGTGDQPPPPPTEDDGDTRAARLAVGCPWLPFGPGCRGFRSGWRRRPRAQALLVLLDLLVEVEVYTDLVYGLDLGLDPVDVLFLGPDHLLEHAPRRVVTHLGGVADGLPQGVHGRHLRCQVQVQVLPDRLPHHHLPQALHVGHPLQVEDMGDEVLGVLHLVEADVAKLLVQPLEAPVAAHLRLDDVLVDCRQLDGEDAVEPVYDAVLGLH